MINVHENINKIYASVLITVVFSFGDLTYTYHCHTKLLASQLQLLSLLLPLTQCLPLTYTRTVIHHSLSFLFIKNCLCHKIMKQLIIRRFIWLNRTIIAYRHERRYCNVMYKGMWIKDINTIRVALC